MGARTEALTVVRTRVAAASGIAAWTLVGTNRVPRTPASVGDKFIEELVLGDASVDRGLLSGNARTRRITATVQWTLCVPVGAGVTDLLAMADALEAALTPTTPLTTTSGAPVLVTSVTVGSVGGNSEDDAWARVPVLVTYDVLT